MSHSDGPRLRLWWPFTIWISPGFLCSVVLSDNPTDHRRISIDLGFGGEIGFKIARQNRHLWTLASLVAIREVSSKGV